MKGSLAPERAHLWCLRTESVTDLRLLRAYEGLLSEEERAQRMRFRFAEGQHQYLLTRALLRTTLSRYADVAPERWVFARNAYGRPEIAGPPDVPPLRFNLSHTAGLVVCLVALGREVGVDVERTAPVGDLIDIAERHFSAFETSALRALPEAEQPTRFFEYWTLKESYIKARGMGLSLSLRHFSFRLDGGIRISFDPEIPDDPGSWRFALYRPGPGHVLAASIRSTPGSAVVIELRETVPLAGD